MDPERSHQADWRYLKRNFRDSSDMLQEGKTRQKLTGNILDLVIESTNKLAIEQRKQLESRQRTDLRHRTPGIPLASMDGSSIDFLPTNKT